MSKNTAETINVTVVVEMEVEVKTYTLATRHGRGITLHSNRDKLDLAFSKALDEHPLGQKMRRVHSIKRALDDMMDGISADSYHTLFHTREYDQARATQLYNELCELLRDLGLSSSDSEFRNNVYAWLLTGKPFMSD